MKAVSKRFNLRSNPFASQRVCDFSASLLVSSSNDIFIAIKFVFKLWHASSREDHRVVDKSFRVDFACLLIINHREVDDEKKTYKF